jgi:hypothetical protein
MYGSDDRDPNLKGNSQNLGHVCSWIRILDRRTIPRYPSKLN